MAEEVQVRPTEERRRASGRARKNVERFTAEPGTSYAGGDFTAPKTEPRRIRKASKERPSLVPLDFEPVQAVRRRLKALWRRGNKEQYYEATVAAHDASNTDFPFTIAYDDGEVEQGYLGQCVLRVEKCDRPYDWLDKADGSASAGDGAVEEEGLADMGIHMAPSQTGQPDSRPAEQEAQATASTADVAATTVAQSQQLPPEQCGKGLAEAPQVGALAAPQERPAERAGTADRCPPEQAVPAGEASGVLNVGGSLGQGNKPQVVKTPNPQTTGQVKQQRSPSAKISQPLTKRHLIKKVEGEESLGEHSDTKWGLVDKVAAADSDSKWEDKTMGNASISQDHSLSAAVPKTELGLLRVPSAKTESRVKMAMDVNAATARGKKAAQQVPEKRSAAALGGSSPPAVQAMQPKATAQPAAPTLMETDIMDQSNLARAASSKLLAGRPKSSNNLLRLGKQPASRSALQGAADGRSTKNSSGQAAVSRKTPPMGSKGQSSSPDQAPAREDRASSPPQAADSGKAAPLVVDSPPAAAAGTKRKNPEATIGAPESNPAEHPAKRDKLMDKGSAVNNRLLPASQAPVGKPGTPLVTAMPRTTSIAIPASLKVLSRTPARTSSPGAWGSPAVSEQEYEPDPDSEPVGPSDQEIEAEVLCNHMARHLAGLTRARESIGKATTAALGGARVNACARITRMIADAIEKEEKPAKRVDMLYLVDSILQGSLHPGRPGCGPGSQAGQAFSRVIGAALPRFITAVMVTLDGVDKATKVLQLWLRRKLLQETLLQPQLDRLKAAKGSMPDAPAPAPANPALSRAAFTSSAQRASQPVGKPKTLHLAVGSVGTETVAAVLENQYGSMGKQTFNVGSGDGKEVVQLKLKDEDSDDDDDDDDDGDDNTKPSRPVAQSWQAQAEAEAASRAARGEDDRDSAGGSPWHRSPSFDEGMNGGSRSAKQGEFPARLPPGLASPQGPSSHARLPWAGGTAPGGNGTAPWVRGADPGFYRSRGPLMPPMHSTPMGRPLLRPLGLMNGPPGFPPSYPPGFGSDVFQPPPTHTDVAAQLASIASQAQAVHANDSRAYNTAQAMHFPPPDRVMHSSSGSYGHRAQAVSAVASSQAAVEDRLDMAGASDRTFEEEAPPLPPEPEWDPDAEDAPPMPEEAPPLPEEDPPPLPNEPPPLPPPPGFGAADAMEWQAMPAPYPVPRPLPRPQMPIPNHSWQQRQYHSNRFS